MNTNYRSLFRVRFLFSQISFLGVILAPIVMCAQTDPDLTASFKPEYSIPDSSPSNLLSNSSRSIGDYRAVIDTVKDYSVRNDVLTHTNSRIYTFDETGNLVVLESHSYNQNLEQLIPVTRSVYEYDSNGNRTIDTIYNFNLASNIWNYLATTHSQYDSEGNLLQSETQRWKPDIQAWETSEKAIAEYMDGLLISFTNYNWNTTLGDFIAINRTVYEYTPDRLLEGTFLYNINFATGELRLWDRTYRGYNEERLVSLYETYRLDIGSGEMRIQIRAFYFYEDGMFVNSILNRQPVFQEDTIVWNMIEKSEQFYTESGKDDYFLIYSWNESLEDWVLASRRVNTYDQYENLTDINFETMSQDEPGVWIPNNHTNFTFDYEFESGSYLGIGADQSGHMITTRVVTSFLPTTRVTNRNEYIFKEISVSTSDMDVYKEDFLIYPNPSSDFVVIKKENWTGGTQEITVYDLSGRLVHQTPYHGFIEMDIRSWAPGVYLIILQGADGKREGASQFLKH